MAGYPAVTRQKYKAEGIGLEVILIALCAHLLSFEVFGGISISREVLPHSCFCLHALPLTEQGAKWVRLKVILIALLLICLDFKVLEGQVGITRSTII